MRSYARKVDGNHGEVRAALRAIGVGVHDTSGCGGGFPDMLCAYRGRLYLIEVKNGRNSPSGRKLTVAQVQLRSLLASHGVTLHVVESADEALGLFGASVTLTGPERFAEDAG